MSGANDYQGQVVQRVDAKAAAPEPEEERLGWLRPVVLAHSPATDFAQRFGPDQPAGSDGYAGVEVSGRPAIAFAQSLEEHLQRVKGEPASPERDAGGRAQDKIGSRDRERFTARFEVMREPDIVVAEVSNQGGSGQGAPNIIRPALLTPMALQVNESHPRIRRGIAGNNLGGVIRAGVADDNQFPIRERLPENTLDRVGKDAAPIVGRNYHRDRRRCHGQMKH